MAAVQDCPVELVLERGQVAGLMRPPARCTADGKERPACDAGSPRPWSREERAQWIAAVQAASRQLQMAQWRTDHSTFSALHVDAVRHPGPAKRPAAVATAGRGMSDSQHTPPQTVPSGASACHPRPCSQEAEASPLPDIFLAPLSVEEDLGSALVESGTGELATSLATNGVQAEGTIGPPKAAQPEEAAKPSPRDLREEQNVQQCRGVEVFAAEATKEGPVAAAHPVQPQAQGAPQKAHAEIGETPATPVESSDPFQVGEARLLAVAKQPWRPKRLPTVEGLDVQSTSAGGSTAMTPPESPVGPPPADVDAISAHADTDAPTGQKAGAADGPTSATDSPEAAGTEPCGEEKREAAHDSPGPAADGQLGDFFQPAKTGRASKTRDGSKRASPQISPSPTGKWSPTGSAVPRMEELRRTVQSWLNKICPETLAAISEKMAEIKVHNAEELEHVISLIFKKALSEPHYCETYADLMFGLRSAFPEFPSGEGGKPVTFKAVLLNICQGEFETLPAALASAGAEASPTACGAEDLGPQRKRTRDRVLANMKLLGHLFLRQLVSGKVIGSVIQELALCDKADEAPEEHAIECALELLMSIGHTLESLPSGKHAVAQVCGRLLDLKQQKGRAGRGLYCKRVQFAIQDLLDTRAAGWARRVFSGVAKTKDEIRLEQQRELSAQALGKEIDSSQRIVAGQRPVYLANS